MVKYETVGVFVTTRKYMYVYSNLVIVNEALCNAGRLMGYNYCRVLYILQRHGRPRSTWAAL